MSEANTSDAAGQVEANTSDDAGQVEANTSDAADQVSAEAVQEEYSKAEFGDLEGETGPAGVSEANLEVILDVSVSLTLEVGRTMINVRDLLQLNQGSVVELDRLAGEPLDVLANGTLVAHGEVVVVNDKFGIRLTDVVSPAERVQKLR